jgi:hypothetical protein
VGTFPSAIRFTSAVAVSVFHVSTNLRMYQGVGVTSSTDREERGREGQRYQEQRALIDLTLYELERDLQLVEDQAARDEPPG